MTKKISCRVVRSIPLTKRGGERRKAYRPNSKDRRNSYITVKNAQVKKAGHSVTYTAQSGIAKVFINDSPTGQSLDSYV